MAKELTKEQRTLRQRLFDISNDYESVKAMAEDIKVSRQSLGFWINGERTPTTPELVKISKELNISIDYLLGLSDCNSLDADVQSVAGITGLSVQSVERIMSLGKNYDDEEVNDESHGFYIDLLNDIVKDERFNDVMDSVFKAYSVTSQFIYDDANRLGQPKFEKEKGITLSMADSMRYFISDSSNSFKMIIDDICGELIKRIIEEKTKAKSEE